MSEFLETELCIAQGANAELRLKAARLEILVDRMSAECASLRTNYDSSRNEVKRMGAEIERLRALSSTKDLAAIQAVLGNGADEEAWPPGTHYADALGPYVDSLRAEIERLKLELAAQAVTSENYFTEIKRLTPMSPTAPVPVGGMIREVGRLRADNQQMETLVAHLRNEITELVKRKGGAGE